MEQPGGYRAFWGTTGWSEAFLGLSEIPNKRSGVSQPSIAALAKALPWIARDIERQRDGIEKLCWGDFSRALSRFASMWGLDPTFVLALPIFLKGCAPWVVTCLQSEFQPDDEYVVKLREDWSHVDLDNPIILTAHSVSAYGDGKCGIELRAAQLHAAMIELKQGPQSQPIRYESRPGFAESYAMAGGTLEPVDAC